MPEPVHSRAAAQSTAALRDGSRTQVIHDVPTAGSSGDEAQRDGHGGRGEVAGVLRLRGGPTRERRVQWEEGVVDNEGLGRKSSKICCIYHKPRAFAESSDESSSSDSSDESDSDSDSGSSAYSSESEGGAGGPRRPSVIRSRRREDDGHHHHSHDHEHACDGAHTPRAKENGGGGKGRKRKKGGSSTMVEEEAERPRSPNAYERQPNPKSRG